MLKAPKFWYYKRISFMAIILSPLSFIWVLGTFLKKKISKNQKSKIPVIAVGSAIIGGSGKTPSVLYICEELEKSGYRPHIVSKGYGGSSKDIIKVNPNMDYSFVGDEALMMSNYYPTWVSKDKYRAFESAESDGANVLVLDDALQSFDILKNLSVYVYDGIQSFGNRLLVPAGPLRETIKSVVNRSQIFFLINSSFCDEFQQKKSKFILNYKIQINTELKEKKLIAFAGLGFNKKFFDQLNDENLKIVQYKEFPDHHQYSLDDMYQLLDIANKNDAFLITTEKDHIRVPNEFKGSVGIIYGKIKSNDQIDLVSEIEKYF